MVITGKTYESVFADGIRPTDRPIREIRISAKRGRDASKCERNEFYHEPVGRFGHRSKSQSKGEFLTLWSLGHRAAGRLLDAGAAKSKRVT
jgi:hypothetical protein